MSQPKNMSLAEKFIYGEKARGKPWRLKCREQMVGATFAFLEFGLREEVTPEMHLAYLERSYRTKFREGASERLAALVVPLIEEE